MHKNSIESEYDGTQCSLPQVTRSTPKRYTRKARRDRRIYAWVSWRVIKRPWPNDTEKKLNLKARRDEQNEQVTEGNPGILGSRAKTRCSAGASARIATKLNRVLSTVLPPPPAPSSSHPVARPFSSTSEQHPVHPRGSAYTVLYPRHRVSRGRAVKTNERAAAALN